jgi:hypothetical protein
MPEVSADGRVFTVRIKPGIFFADDPAFKGRPRELVAQDYVYSLKRFYDPRWNSSDLYLFESLKLPGLSELRERAIAGRKPFDYDTEVEGVRALDRYTLRITLGVPDPRFIYMLADAADHRRGGARGGGALRRRHRRAPGGHRRLPAEELAPRRRASCSSATRAFAPRCSTKASPADDPGHARPPPRWRAGACPLVDEWWWTWWRKSSRAG